MTETKIEIISEGTEWESIKIKRKWEAWTIDSADKDGDVEIACEGADGTAMLFLSQDELKQVIAFLQKQIK